MIEFFKNIRIALILSVLMLAQGVFAQENNIDFARANYDGPTPKYIFYFIGDGFGFAQAHATEAYITAIEKSDTLKKLEMNKFPYHGYTTTYCSNKFITKSAEAGTALSTGYKTSRNTLGMNSSREYSYKNIAEMALEKGWKVGIVSSVSLDHATPAAFYAHQPHREMYHEISRELSKSNFNYFAGGGFIEPVKTFISDGEIIDSKNSRQIAHTEFKYDILKVAQQSGYSYINSKEDFLELKKGDDKVIAVAPNLVYFEALPYAIDKTDEDITLGEFTAKGIELLDNKKGFFMMVESGKIDWACHANDAATTIKEVIEFDHAITEAIKFYNKHPNETLIVVTSDHETGGMGLGFSVTEYESYYELLQYQKISSDDFTILINKYRESHKENANFEDVMKMVKTHFGLGDASKNLSLNKFETKRFKDAFYHSMIEEKKRSKNDEMLRLYGGYDPVSITACTILAEKAGIGWATSRHTASPVPVRAIGVGSELFTNFLDNTDLPKNIIRLMQIKEKR